jgi:hypothetical protein
MGRVAGPALRRWATAALAAVTVCAGAWAGGPRSIAIVFRDAGEKGTIVVRRGAIARPGEGDLSADGAFSCAHSSRVEMSIDGADGLSNAERTLVTVQRARDPFTFFLGDVRSGYPIFIPAYGVIVTEAGDKRGYQEIAAAIKARGLESDLGKIESAPEESFADAANSARSQSVETWLGLSRDVRLFSVSPRLEWIQAR